MSHAENALCVTGFKKQLFEVTRSRGKGLEKFFEDIFDVWFTSFFTTDVAAQTALVALVSDGLQLAQKPPQFTHLLKKSLVAHNDILVQCQALKAAFTLKDKFGLSLEVDEELADLLAQVYVHFVDSLQSTVSPGVFLSVLECLSLLYTNKIIMLDEKRHLELRKHLKQLMEGNVLMDRHLKRLILTIMPDLEVATIDTSLLRAILGVSDESVSASVLTALTQMSTPTDTLKLVVECIETRRDLFTESDLECIAHEALKAISREDKERRSVLISVVKACSKLQTALSELCKMVPQDLPSLLRAGYLDVAIALVQSVNDFHFELWLLLLLFSSVPESSATTHKDSFVGHMTVQMFRSGVSALQLEMFGPLISGQIDDLKTLLVGPFKLLPVSGDFLASHLMKHRQYLVREMLPRFFKTLNMSPEVIRDALSRFLNLASKDLDVNPHTDIIIHMLRVCVRGGCNYFVLPANCTSEDLTIICSDWAVRNNAKQAKRKKLATENADMIQVAQELMRSQSLFVVVIDKTQYVSVPFDIIEAALRSANITSAYSAASLLMIERRLLLPPRTRLEVDAILHFLQLQVENCINKERRANFSEIITSFLPRWKAPFQSLSEQNLSVAEKTVVVPFVEGLASIMDTQLRSDVCYPYQSAALRLLSVACKVTEPKVIRRFIPDVGLVLECLNSNWEEVHLEARTVVPYLIAPSDLVAFSRRSEDTWDDVIAFIWTLLKSPKLRDFRTGASWFALISDWILQGRYSDEVLQGSLLQETLGLSGHDVQVQDWLRGLIAWVSRSEGPLPMVHGALCCLEIAIEGAFKYRKEELCLIVPEMTQLLLHENLSSVIRPVTKSMLKFIALGEDKLMLSQCVSGDLSDFIRVDCRGHLVMSGTHDPSLSDPSTTRDPSVNDPSTEASTDKVNESTLIHPSSFSRFWMSVKFCGDVAKTSVASAHLVPSDSSHRQYVRDVMEHSADVLLGSRHPGLLERWSLSLGACVQRGTQIAGWGIAGQNEQYRAWGHDSFHLLRRILAAIEPQALLKRQLNNTSDDILSYTGEDLPAVPPPLRKSASLCACVSAVLDNKLFTKPKEFVMTDDQNQPISHYKLAHAVVTKLLRLTARQPSADPVLQEAIVSSKVHAANVLRNLLTQKPALIAALAPLSAKLHYSRVFPMSSLDPAASTEVPLIFPLNDVLLAALRGLSMEEDFRVKNAFNLLYVAVQELITNASKISGDCNNRYTDKTAESIESRLEGSGDFYIPNVEHIARRSHHALARPLEEVFRQCPEVFDLLDAPEETARAVLVSISLLKPPPMDEDQVRYILSCLKSCVETASDSWHVNLMQKVVKKGLETSSFWERQLVAGIVCSIALSIDDLAALIRDLIDINDDRDSQEWSTLHLRMMVSRGLLRHAAVRGHQGFVQVVKNLLKILDRAHDLGDSLVENEAILNLEEILSMDGERDAKDELVSYVMEGKLLSVDSSNVMIAANSASRLVLPCLKLAVKNQISHALKFVSMMTNSQVQEECLSTLLHLELSEESESKLDETFLILCRPSPILVRHFVAYIEAHLVNRLDAQTAVPILIKLISDDPMVFLSIANVLLALDKWSEDYTERVMDLCSPATETRVREKAAKVFAKLWKSQPRDKLWPTFLTLMCDESLETIRVPWLISQFGENESLVLFNECVDRCAAEMSSQAIEEYVDDHVEDHLSGHLSGQGLFVTSFDGKTIHAEFRPDSVFEDESDNMLSMEHVIMRRLKQRRSSSSRQSSSSSSIDVVVENCLRCSGYLQRHFFCG